MTSHPNEDKYSQSSNAAAVNMDPADAALLSGPSGHQNDAAVDEVKMPPLEEPCPEVDRTIYPLLVVSQMKLITQGNNDDQGINSDTTDNDPDAAVNDDHLTPPLLEAPPQCLRTTSPGTRTDILEKELITHPNDKDQGCNTVTVDKDTDPNAPGLQRELRRRQHEAPCNTALEESPPNSKISQNRISRNRSLQDCYMADGDFKGSSEVDQGSSGDAIDDEPDGPGLQRGHRDDAADNSALPAFDEFKIYLPVWFGVSKFVFDSSSEMNLICHQRPAGSTTAIGNSQHLEDSDNGILRHLEDSDLEFFRPWKTPTMGGRLSVTVGPANSYASRILGSSRLLCMHVPGVVVGVAVPVLFLVLGILARFPILTWYVFLFLCWASLLMSGFWPCTYFRGYGRVLH